MFVVVVVVVVILVLGIISFILPIVSDNLMAIVVLMVEVDGGSCYGGGCIGIRYCIIYLAGSYATMIVVVVMMEVDKEAMPNNHHPCS